MQLNNASLANQSLRGYARFLTNSDSTSYANADLDANINRWYHLLVNEILESEDDIDFNMETETISLVTDTQTYSVTGKVLRIKRIEVTYDGTNWYDVSFMDVNERGEATDTTSISNDFEKTEPYADVYVDDETVKIDLYPIPDTDVTDGLKVWKVTEVTELSADSDEPVLPEAYHKALCYGAAVDYFEKYHPEKADRMEAKFEKAVVRLRGFYARRHKEKAWVLKQSYSDYDYGQD